MAGINSADWPAAEWTKERVKNDVEGYARSAPPEPTQWGWIAALSGAGVAALGLLRVVAPLVPGGGPLVKMAADLVWNVMATRDQKKTDQAQVLIHQAASSLAPVLAGFLIIQDRPQPHGFDGDREMETQARGGTLKGPLTPAMADGYQVKDEITGLIYACYDPKFEAQQIARLERVTVEEFGPDRKGQK